MNSLFSVDEEIDFSDDDIDFNGGKERYKACYEIPDTVPVSLNQRCKSLFENESSHGSRSMASPSTTRIDKQNCDNDIFNSFLNDETDELLSQIDLPENNLCKNTTQMNGRCFSENISERTKMNFVNTNIYSKKESCPKSGPVHLSRSEMTYKSSNSEHFPHQTAHESEKYKTRNISENLSVPFDNYHSKQKDRVSQPFETVVSCENITPVKRVEGAFRSNKRKLSDSNERKNTKSQQRRFPGPAGLLPSLNNISCLEKLKSPEPEKGKRTLTPLTPKTPIQSLLSSSQDDDFSRTVWNDVQRQIISLYPGIPSETISEILRKATMNLLSNGKVSLFCGLIKSFSISGSGGKLIIKDPSGEINGTLHKNVLDEYESDLSQGSGLILKDISVYSPTLKKHYINIIPSNIVQIFPAEVNDLMSTQSQPTQIFQNNADKENSMKKVDEEKIDYHTRNTISKSAQYSLIENDERLDVFGNEDELDDLLSDDICLF